MDIANEIKQTLSMLSVAEMYGITVSKGSVCICPFHPDTHPSMKLYAEPGRGFHCYSCSANGSVIDFVMKLFGLDFRGALVRLNNDFRLNLITNEKPDPVALEKIRHERAERKAELKAFRALYSEKATEYSRLTETYWNTSPTNAQDEWTEEFINALTGLGKLDCWFGLNPWR